MDSEPKPGSQSVAKVRVWDLPTRLFHWLLVLFMIATWISGEIGGDAMDWHMRGGYIVLALVLFRIVWGFVGSRYARFSEFVHEPGTIREYVNALRAGACLRSVGHNPLGALAMLAMLALSLLQATAGLFASDDIGNEGPLTALVSNAAGGMLSSLHRVNAKLILALVLLHVAAIAFYLLKKKDNLVLPMITGDKPGLLALPADDGVGVRLRALIVLALAAGLVYYIATQ